MISFKFNHSNLIYSIQIYLIKEYVKNLLKVKFGDKKATRWCEKGSQVYTSCLPKPGIDSCISDYCNTAHINHPPSLSTLLLRFIIYFIRSILVQFQGIYFLFGFFILYENNLCYIILLSTFNLFFYDLYFLISQFPFKIIVKY